MYLVLSWIVKPIEKSKDFNELLYKAMNMSKKASQCQAPHNRPTSMPNLNVSGSYDNNSNGEYVSEDAQQQLVSLLKELKIVKGSGNGHVKEGGWLPM